MWYLVALEALAILILAWWLIYTQGERREAWRCQRLHWRKRERYSAYLYRILKATSAASAQGLARQALFDEDETR